MESTETRVHPSAVVDPTAKLGKGVQIGPFVVIGPQVELGDRCFVGPHSVVEYATVGADCRFLPHAFVGTEPQDLKFKGEITHVEIGARTTVRECATIHRGTSASGVTKVGSDCLIMAYAHVAHDCVLADHVILANAATLAGHVDVGPGAFFGGLSAIHQFVRVGAGAMIGGGSMVPNDVAPFCLTQGDRAKIVGLNVVGLRRRGLSRESLSVLKAAYQTLFYTGVSLSEAIVRMDRGPHTPELDIFLSFLRGSSARGICRPAPKSSGEDADSSLS
ncbi:MAG: acyl-ACP--UDP-N-acetylglucosamine O-acyltransferase [Elusimicrobia bacterium]|jgi:UDP-N-acetylglucosamine acyltransferase|nr:acyl-ACP--UDP-N-acetylglucosamine O-acyltransferase [Elusimicrobiota bacterium]